METSEMNDREFVNYLNEIEKKYRGKSVVAAYYELGKKGKSFSRAMRELRLPARPIELSHFLTMNHQCLNCGKLYEIDEKATVKFNKEIAQSIIDQKTADEFKVEGANQLANAINTIAKGSKPKNSVPVEVEGEQEKESDVHVDEFVGEKSESELAFEAEQKAAKKKK